MLEVNDSNFSEKVLKSEKPVLVDFSATWCGPCKMLTPVLNQLSTEHTDVEFVKVDIDKSIDLSVKYDVSAVPTLILFKEGEAVKKHVGFTDKAGLLSFLG